MNNVRANYTFTDWPGLEIECFLLAKEYTEPEREPQYLDIHCTVESSKQFGMKIDVCPDWRYDTARLIENELNANDHDGIKWRYENE